MALGYTRITDEQDQMRNVLDKGEYHFCVKSIAEKPTKRGANRMLEVELGVVDLNGRELTIKDWIVLDMENMAWKLRHFAATCGLIDRYDDQLLEARDFLGKSGIAKISIRQYEKDGELRKANSVADYIKPGQVKDNTEKAPSNEFADDDIKF